MLSSVSSIVRSRSSVELFDDEVEKVIYVVQCICKCKVSASTSRVLLERSFVSGVILAFWRVD